MDELSSYSPWQWFELFGSSWTLDSLILFLATPVSLAGVLLNSLNFYVLSNKKFESKIIFSFLRVYSLNSLLMCLVLSTYFNITYNYFEITNTFIFRAYSSIVYIPIVTVLAFFSGFLDILISVERLLDFFPNARKLTSLKSCFILMLVVILITLPYFFIYYPAHLDVNLSQNETFRLYYIGLSEFGQSSIGEVVNNVLFFIKDVVAFIVEIVLNISLVVLLRKHVNKKIKVITLTPDSNPVNNHQIPASPSQMQPPTSPLGISEGSAQFTFRSNSLDPIALAYKRNKNITMMVVVICVFSGFAHITTIMCNSSLAIAQNSLSYGFCFGANFFLSFKGFSNFFIFFLFNNLFCTETKKLIRLQSTSNS